MARSDADKRGNRAVEFLESFQEPVPGIVKASPQQAMPVGAAAEFVLGAPAGSVFALGGIDGESLRVLLDQVDPATSDRRALFARIEAAPTTELIVGQVLDLLADTARRLWPLWFTDVSFAACRGDTLGRLAAGVIARKAAAEIEGVSPSWTGAAARLALDDRPPRVADARLSIELSQLALAISRSGLVLIADVAAAAVQPEPLVRALEWIAQHGRMAVVALFADLPVHAPPFDRILYRARSVIAQPGLIEPGLRSAEVANQTPWIAPWRGVPHPLSEIEQRLAKMLAEDEELAPLFLFNRAVETIRGSRPKVDLLWAAGRLVVELDGYGSHGNRLAFMYDRHRDYELTLSGYTVLRLANDEIAQDLEKAVEKIRDLVKLCRTRAVLEE